MEVELILKACGVALIITLVCQIVSRAGREEQSLLVSLVGMVIVFLLIADRISALISALRGVFGL